MPAEDYIEIPLRRRDGSLRAHAVIDAEDAHLAVHRWHLHCNGYAARTLWLPGGKRRAVLLHRAILGLTFGDGVEVDHIDGDPLNCRRSNLRVVTHAQNGQNVPSQAGSSLYRGVTWHKADQKWKAQAHLGGVNHYLGSFDDEQEAAAAAQAWRIINMPFTVEARAAASDPSGLSLPARRRAI